MYFTLKGPISLSHCQQVSGCFLWMLYLLHLLRRDFSLLGSLDGASFRQRLEILPAALFGREFTAAALLCPPLIDKRCPFSQGSQRKVLEGCPWCVCSFAPVVLWLLAVAPAFSKEARIKIAFYIPRAPSIIPWQQPSLHILLSMMLLAPSTEPHHSQLSDALN